MTFLLIGLGANLPGDAGGPKETLLAALNELKTRGELALKAVSRPFASAAIPAGSGPDFVNAAAAIETELSPTDVLGCLHDIEDRLGRERPSRWAPRVCDLDLLAMGDLILPDRATVTAWMALGPEAAAKTAPPEGLMLPHPRLHERGFVLAPLAEIAPHWLHPVTGNSVREMLDRLPEEGLLGLQARDWHAA